MRRLLPLLGGFLFLSFMHPFYMSVTDLSYKEKEKALQGSVRLFVNDLEDALKKTEGRPVDLIHPTDTAKTKQVLLGYLKKRLSIKVNGKAMAYSFLGFEQEHEALWLYIELTACPLPKRVEIDNTLLYDFLPGQSNIVHLEVKGNKKSLKVDNPEKALKFEF